MENIFLPLHLVALLFVAWNVFHADHLGFNWMRGKITKLDAKVVRKYHRRTWAGLLAMIVTGFLLFWPMHEYLLARPQFLVKMAFVITLICNSFAIGNLQKRATEYTFKDLSFSQKLSLFVSGAISTLAWLGAFVGAFYIVEE